MSLDLPYFDDIFDRLADSPLATLFRRHVHWGYFDAPADADGSDGGFLTAAEAMTDRVCRAGRVADGLRILDVGCGFGGTIAHLNEHLGSAALTGLNIDERQVARARETVKPMRGNEVRFVHGDACAMPLEGSAFDVVLAVECIFHFPSRRTFFGEARRVLRAGGTLMVSDFLVADDKIDEMAGWVKENEAAQGGFFGSVSAPISPTTYARLGRAKGFDLLADIDITAATMPTYPWLRRVYGDAGLGDAVKAVNFLEELARRGLLQYRVLSFEARP